MHAVEVMNNTAGADWGRLFQLNATCPNGPNYTHMVFFLEFSCKMTDIDDEHTPAPHNGQERESVVAQLKLTVKVPRNSAHEKLIVCMAAGVTAVCVRYMHLATILRACALLVAQQIAYLGSGSESVRFMGDPVSTATLCIYNKIFRHLHNANGTDCTRMRDGDDSCHQMIAQLSNPGDGTIAQSTMNVSQLLWHWNSQSAYMYKGPLPLQIRHHANAHAPAGCSVFPSAHFVPAHASEPARAWLPATCHRAAAQALAAQHAADAQACVNACCGCTPPTHLFAAAALPEDPYSSPEETADVLTGILCEFADDLKGNDQGASPWSFSNIDACVNHAVIALNDAAGVHWGVMFQLSAKQVQTQEENTWVYYLQFEGKAVLSSDTYQPSRLIPSNECVLSRLKLVIKEANPNWFDTSEYTKPLPKYLVTMDQGSTVICVRQMYLATLLRACALLVAQQIAYLATDRENIGFVGIPVTDATHRIYADLFQYLRGPTLRPLPSRERDRILQRQKWHAQLYNWSYGITPRSIVNVVDILWTWYRDNVWIYQNGPLPAQIRHLSPSAAPAAVGPVPGVCHRAPAQMSVHMHELFKYHDFCCFMPEINPATYAENWQHVLRYFPGLPLTYETIQTWPNGRLVCFYIWWKYSWGVLQDSHNKFDQDSMDKKLNHALLCENIPGASIEDFFNIRADGISSSDAPPEYVNSGPMTGINMWSWIDHGVSCCQIAEHGEQENTEVQNYHIFNTLLLFFVLQSNYNDHFHSDKFSTHTVRDAFEHLAEVWDVAGEPPAKTPSRRQTFAQAFGKLQAEYKKNKDSVSKEKIWALILAPAKTDAYPASR